MENYYAISAISDIFQSLKYSKNGSKLILNEKNQYSIFIFFNFFFEEF